MKQKCLCGFVAPFCLLLFAAGSAAAASGKHNANPLDDYLARARQKYASSAVTNGSLWSEQGRLADLGSDLRARRVADVVQIRIVEQLTASAAGNVKGERAFKTNSGITAMAGKINTAGISDLFTANSDTALAGQAQTSSASILATVLTGTVVEVLPNGFLVVQAARTLNFNHERQEVLVRGIVRPTDLASDNSVLSTAIADLQVEVKGHGIINDNTRPPNFIVRALLRIVGF